MDFIINPTGRCNFACEFCAASKLCNYVMKTVKM